MNCGYKLPYVVGYRLDVFCVVRNYQIVWFAPPEYFLECAGMTDAKRKPIDKSGGTERVEGKA